MAQCELGGHGGSRATELKWCCPDCLDTFRMNRNEVTHQAELDRQFKADQAELARQFQIANRRSPYQLLPYLGLMLGFSMFLILVFL